MSTPSTSRSKKSTKRRYNRAERRAMQVRAQDSALSPQASVEEAESAPAPVSGKKSRSQSFRRVPLSREEEYAYIHSDLRRLIFTAGPLLGLMLVLLFVLD